jgi:hypothetical protein
VRNQQQVEALRVDSNTSDQRREGIAGWEREHTSAGMPVVRVGSFASGYRERSAVDAGLPNECHDELGHGFIHRVCRR